MSRRANHSFRLHDDGHDYTGGCTCGWTSTEKSQIGTYGAATHALMNFQAHAEKQEN